MGRDRWSSPDARKFSATQAVGNLALLHVVDNHGGVDRRTMDNLSQLKTALAEEFLAENGGDDNPSKEYVADLVRQLTELAANHDPVAKAAETLAARERMFGRHEWFHRARS